MIQQIIGPQNLEIIRDKIGEILVSEFANQYALSSDVDLSNVKIFAERTIPIDQSESVVISISLFRGKYSNQSVQSTHAAPYTFAIDIMTNSVNKEGAAAYTTSAFLMHKIFGKVRGILMHPEYITLKLTGIVEHTEISDFQVFKDERVGDAQNNAIMQCLFQVHCEEVTGINLGVTLERSDTNILIGLTDKGFQYQAP